MSVNQIQIHVENIKCGGCEKSIVKGLNTIKGLSNIVIDRDQQLVSVTGEQSLRDAIAAKLKQLAPTLLKRLEKQRPEVNGIRIQVQVTDLAPKSPPKSVKKPLTIDSIQEFESLSSQVKDQHLREALIKFAKRQRGDG
jgi:copper chaperone CopZ